MTLRCLLFRHDTRIVTEGDEGRIECRRCQQTIGKTWKLLRPEHVIAEQRAHEALMRDRAERVKRLAQETERPKVVRMTR